MILGGPPGDYQTGRRGLVVDLYAGGALMVEGQREEWGGDEGYVQVWFDANGTVTSKRFVPAGRTWNWLERW